MTGLTDSPEQSFEALRICERILGERQLAVLPLESLVDGARHLLEDEDVPSQPRQGWPREAARCAEKSFLVWPGWTDFYRARCRSQRGSVCRIDAQPFRLLLCRRLRLPSPLSSRTCRCSRLLDILGHRRATCAEVGVLRRRSDVLECAAAQGSRGTRLDERDGLRFRCDLIQCEGRTPSGSLGGRLVPLWRRIICDRHDSGLSLGKGWHSQKRCVAR